jgi:DnaJ domain
VSSNHLYKTLGLAPDASKEEIKEAYLRLVQEYHAHANNAPESEQYFREICEAYIALSKEGAIVVYNQKLKPEPEKSGSSFWQKRYSPAFILGVVAVGVTGTLLGYSLQPKSTIVREIIRETPAESPIITARPEKKLEAQPMVLSPEKSSRQVIPFAKLPNLPKMPPQKVLPVHSLRALPALPILPKALPVVRILPPPAPMASATIRSVEPKKSLMALPLFSPRATSSIPRLPSLSALPVPRSIMASPPALPVLSSLRSLPSPTTLRSQPQNLSPQQPQAITAYSAPHLSTVSGSGEADAADEKLIDKLNAYGKTPNLSANSPKEDEDAQLLSSLNSLQH